MTSQPPPLSATISVPSSMITDDAQKLRILNKCFALFPNTSRSPFITPSDVLLTLKSIDPGAQRIGDEELKAIIAAELLTDEAEFGELSMFEATEVFNRQSRSPVVDFSSFVVMFENKAVMSNSPEILEGALNFLAELTTLAEQVIAAETKARGALEAEHKTSVDHIMSECRRSLQITSLKEKLFSDMERQKRNIQLVNHQTEDGESTRLAQIREERKKAKEEQQRILESEVDIETAYAISMETASRCGSQLKVLRNWQTVGLQVVNQELRAGFSELQENQKRRCDVMDHHLERLDDLITDIGRKLVLTSLSMQGSEGHHKLLDEWQGSRHQQHRDPNDVRYQSVKHLVYGKESNAFDKNLEQLGTDLSWVAVPAEAVNPYRFSNENDYAAAEALSDARNLKSALLAEKSSTAQTDATSLISESATKIISFLEQKRKRSDPKHVEAATLQHAGGEYVLDCLDFEHLVGLCELPIPGSCRLSFVEWADTVSPFHAAASSLHSSPSGSGGKQQRPPAWQTAGMTKAGLCTALRDIARLAYIRISAVCSTEKLVQKLLQEYIFPKMHKLTIDEAVAEAAAAAAAAGTATPAGAKPASALPSQRHTPGPQEEEPNPLTSGNDNISESQQQPEEVAPFNMNKVLIEYVMPVLGGEKGIRLLSKLAASYNKHAVHYHGAVPVSVRGRRGLSSWRVLHALGVVEEASPVAHGAILRSRITPSQIGELYQDKENVSIFLKSLVDASLAHQHQQKSGAALDFEMEASLDAVASFVAFAVPSMMRHLIVQKLVSAITKLVSDSFLAIPGESSMGVKIPLSSRENALEYIFGVLPGEDSDKKIEASPVPFAVVLCTLAVLSEQDKSFPSFKRLCLLLANPVEALELE